MTDAEFKRSIPSLTNEVLLAELRYYGCDPYYRDLWDKVCAEIAGRLGVDWEDLE